MSKNQNDILNDLDFRDLFKRFKSELGQINGTLQDIEKSLKIAKKILKELLRLGITNQETFLNVAPPAVPPASPPVPTATPLVQIITKDIARIARQIRNKQRQLRDLIMRAITFFRVSTLQDALDPFVLLSILDEVITIREEIEALRDELNDNIILLLQIADNIFSS